MSEWRYIVKTPLGRTLQARQTVITRVKAMVRSMHLTLKLPVIRHKATGYGATFYLGIAVNDDDYPDDTLPPYVEELFVRLRMPLTANDRATWPLRDSEAVGFLLSASQYDHLSSPLAFERSVLPALSADLAEAEEIEVPENQEAYDHLLWWCSAKGEGTILQLSELAGNLGLIALEGSVWTVAKKLALLGHLDVVQDEDQTWIWRTAPITLVATGPGQPAFLAGAMSGRLRNRLVTEAGARLDTTNGGPSRIWWPQSPCPDLSPVFGFTPRVFPDAAVTWADRLPTLDQWQASLVTNPDIQSQPHQYTFERYSNGSWVKAEGHSPPSGLYRVQRDEPQFRPKIVYHTAQGSWLNGDFASLRFLSMFLNGAAPEALWGNNDVLFIHPQHRWPALFERALVLASGKLPASSRLGESNLLSYHQVPRTAAEKLATKLRVKLLCKPH